MDLVAALVCDERGLFVGDDVKVSAGVTVDVSVSFTLFPVVRLTEAHVVCVFVPIGDAVIDFVRGSVKDNLLVTDTDEEALGVLL
jgi:hypothetical protein